MTEGKVLTFGMGTRQPKGSPSEAQLCVSVKEMNIAHLAEN